MKQAQAPTVGLGSTTYDKPDTWHAVGLVDGNAAANAACGRGYDEAKADMPWSHGAVRAQTGGVDNACRRCVQLVPPHSPEAG